MANSQISSGRADAGNIVFSTFSFAACGFADRVLAGELNEACVKGTGALYKSNRKLVIVVSLVDLSRLPT